MCYILHDAMPASFNEPLEDAIRSRSLEMTLATPFGPGLRFGTTNPPFCDFLAQLTTQRLFFAGLLRSCSTLSRKITCIAVNDRPILLDWNMSLCSPSLTFVFMPSQTHGGSLVFSTRDPPFRRMQHVITQERGGGVTGR